MASRSVLPALAALIVLALAGCSNESSSSGGPAGPNGFQALLGSTFTHPRCILCHDFGIKSSPVRQAHENRSRDCETCHNVPTWRGPIDSFSFSNVSTFEICEGIKNKFGGDIQLLRDHFATSPRSDWAVDSGLLPNGVVVPTAPPNSSVALLALADQWIANGAVCD